MRLRRPKLYHITQDRPKTTQLFFKHKPANFGRPIIASTNFRTANEQSSRLPSHCVFPASDEHKTLLRHKVPIRMAAESGKAAPAGESSTSKDQSKPQQKGQAAAAAPATTGEEKKPTNAELKKKLKEEKAARRAQAKAVMTAHAPPSGAQPGQSGDGKGGAKPKQKQDGHPGAHHVRSGSRSAHPPPAIKETKPTVPEIFSHLSIARRISITHADKDVHPTVLMLGQQMSTFAISDSITRLEATLLAFKKVSFTSNSMNGKIY